MKKQFLIWAPLAFLITFALSCSTTPVSGNKAFLLTSSASENQQGDEAYKEILQKEKVVSGTPEARMVEEIGKRIAAVANQPDFKWEFKTLQSDEPNAFCLPGGKVAVYTGIFKYAKNEAGLATVMGHEIGHAIARHGGQRMSQQMATNAALAGLAVVGLAKMDNTKKTIAMAALGAGATYGIILPFSRKHETEADEIGLVLMSKAGYDPRESVNFWNRFSVASAGKAPPEFLSTHPNSDTRRDHLRSLLPKVLPDYESSSKLGLGKSF
ncbi:MAG: M48 family metallopeptidase [Bdellovibrionales bacterium]|nr:M48 family metallopeptidase [Bdellovibrionales bacterium]